MVLFINVFNDICKRKAWKISKCRPTTAKPVHLCCWNEDHHCTRSWAPSIRLWSSHHSFLRSIFLFSSQLLHLPRRHIPRCDISRISICTPWTLLRVFYIFLLIIPFTTNIKLLDFIAACSILKFKIRGVTYSIPYTYVHGTDVYVVLQKLIIILCIYGKQIRFYRCHTKITSSNISA